ncbi:hypothetical protein WR25_07960 isoform A [Diploscapter pachys]|uniref:Guanylate cyclase n=1 Tax=Diploscapter pachys TaxID=2018661 RepID=A0A2A2LJT5_9BILA|nr:hypothetical protein WR25_07960 isoform A [Diploscapter pachys]
MVGHSYARIHLTSIAPQRVFVVGQGQTSAVMVLSRLHCCSGMNVIIYTSGIALYMPIPSSQKLSMARALRDNLSDVIKHSPRYGGQSGWNGVWKVKFDFLPQSCLPFGCWILNVNMGELVFGGTLFFLQDPYPKFPLSLEYLAPFQCAVNGDCDDQASNDATTVSVLGLSTDCYMETLILNVKKKLAIADTCQMDVSSFKGYPRTSLLLNSAGNSAAKAINFYLDKWDWRKVAVVSPSSGVDAYASKVRSYLMDSLSLSARTVLVDSRPAPNLPYSELLTQVENDAKRARIFIIFDPTKDASLFRSYYYAMANLGLLQTGEYFVLAFLSYAENFGWINSEDVVRTLYFGAKSVSPFNVTVEDLHLIYRNLLVLSDAPPPFYANPDWASFGDKVVQNLDKAACPPYCNATPKYNSAPRWDRIQKAADSITLLAVAGTDAIDKGMDITNGTQVYEYVLSRTIKSVTGFEEYVDGFGDAIGSAQVYYFSTREDLGGYGLWAIGRLAQPSILQTNWTFTQYPEAISAISFINGTPPPDTPKCGFNNELCGPTHSPLFGILMISLAVVAAVIIAVLFFLYRRYRFEARLHSLDFLINRRDIMLKKHSRTEGSHLIINEYEDFPYDVKTYKSDNLKASEASNFAMRSGESGLAIISKHMEKTRTVQEPSSFASDEEKWNNLTDFAVGMHDGRTVGLKRLYLNDVEFTRSIRMEVLALQEAKHQNIIGFTGMVVENPTVFVAYEFAARGSLRDLLDNEDLPVDDDFVNHVARDIIAGMDYLHSSAVGSHGRLKSTNCLLDSRWMVKLSSFGLRQMRQEENPIREGIQEGKDDLWTAPELLRWSTGLGQCSDLLVQKADVYSVGILLYELFGKNGPWGDEPMEPKNIVRRVRDLEEGKTPFRPDLRMLKDAPELVPRAVSDCWNEDPSSRPTMHQIKKRFRPLTAGLKNSIMDNMVHIIEKYTEKLENEIKERNRELAKEKEKCDELLQMMLPRTIAENLKRGQNVHAQGFECVTVYFSDLPGFHELSSNSEPIDIVNFLNDIYTLFDGIIPKYDVYKVETIGDAYMVASGLPESNGPHHVGEIASMALELMEAISKFKIRHRPDERANLRVGMHIGPVVAGVVGLKMPRYCLFGDTVNTASRMESNGLPNKINCSLAAKELLETLGGYEFEERGLVEMKGKGKQMTYFVSAGDKMARLDRIVREMVRKMRKNHEKTKNGKQSIILRFATVP